MRKHSIFLLAIVLTGCWQVGPDYVKPDSVIPNQWRFSSQEARDTTNLEWWRILGDSELNRLIEQAILANLDLKIATATVEQFIGTYGATRSALFPQITGSGIYSRKQSSGESVDLPANMKLDPPQNNYAQLGLSLNWELDVWGRLRRSNEAAFADLLSHVFVQRGVLLTLASTVSETYISLLVLDKSLYITQNIVKILGEQLGIAEARFREGYSSELEISQVRSEYRRREALIPSIEQNIAQTEHALSLLLAKSPGPIQRSAALDALTLPPVPNGLPSELLLRRPDIQQAEQQLIAANARIGVARGQYFPKIALTGDVGQLSVQAAELFTPGANFWSIGASVLGPIFNAGKIAGQVEAAEAVQRAAVANYQKSILSGFREFENALIARQKAIEQQHKQAQRVESVEHYYRLSQLRYDEGLIDYLIVLDALRQLFEAQIELLQAQGMTFTATIQLYRAMGGGWIVAKESASGLLRAKEPEIFR